MSFNYTILYPVIILVFIFTAACSSDGELNWVEDDGYRWAELETSFFGETGFRELSKSDTGVNFRLDVPDRLKTGLLAQCPAGTGAEIDFYCLTLEHRSVQDVRAGI